MPKKPIDTQDIVGQRFHSLVVLRYTRKIHGHHYYRCLCDCGNEAVVQREHIRSGLIASCGCKLAEYRQSAQAKAVANRLYRYRQALTLATDF